MGRKDELMDDTVAAYEEATGQLPDTRDFVAIEDVVNNYVQESDAKEQRS